MTPTDEVVNRVTALGPSWPERRALQAAMSLPQVARLGVQRRHEGAIRLQEQTAGGNQNAIISTLHAFALLTNHTGPKLQQYEQLRAGANCRVLGQLQGAVARDKD